MKLLQVIVQAHRLGTQTTHRQIGSSFQEVGGL